MREEYGSTRTLPGLTDSQRPTTLRRNAGWIAHQCKTNPEMMNVETPCLRLVHPIRDDGRQTMQILNPEPIDWILGIANQDLQ